MRWPDSYCPSNPESYRVLFDLTGRGASTCSSPRRVHIGHDEWRAGAFCSRCRGKDTGALYAEDVLKIQRAPREPRASRPGSGATTSSTATTASARAGPRAGSSATSGPTRAPPATSWRRRARSSTSSTGRARKETRPSRSSAGRSSLGNFEGTSQKDWPARIARGGALGGEVSSWGAWEEFVLGKLQVPEAVYSANLLWSSHYPKSEDGIRAGGGALCPRCAGCSRRRRRLRPTPIPCASRCWTSPPPSTTRPRARRLRPFRPRPRPRSRARASLTRSAIPRAARRSCVVARRPGDQPTRAALPVAGRWASLLFLQAATAEGRPGIHAGDQTHFPRESSELLGFYEIRYADELVATHEIRFDETIARWDAGVSKLLYFARPVRSGPSSRRPRRRAVGQRVDEPPAGRAHRLRHARGVPWPIGRPAHPPRVTAVEKPRVEDYR